MPSQFGGIPVSQPSRFGGIATDPIEPASFEVETDRPFAVGVGRSVAETGQGIKQIGMKIGEMAGIVEPEEVEAYRQYINEERELYERSIGSQRSSFNQ